MTTAGPTTNILLQSCEGIFDHEMSERIARESVGLCREAAPNRRLGEAPERPTRSNRGCSESILKRFCYAFGRAEPGVARRKRLGAPIGLTEGRARLPRDQHAPTEAVVSRS
jgi:hypothetical protein